MREVGSLRTKTKIGNGGGGVSGKPVIKHYVLKFRFMESVCVYRDHWCNGKHIPDMDANGVDNNAHISDKKPCPHFRNNKCKHPEHRFNSKGE